MYTTPILQEADLAGQQGIQAQVQNQQRLLQGFTGQHGEMMSPAVQGMFDQGRNNANLNMHARLGELQARQLLHQQKMDMFYKQLAFQKLQNKWANRDETSRMIGTGLGALGGGMAGLFHSAPETYDPSQDASLDALYSNRYSNQPLNYEPVPDWFIRQRSGSGTGRL